MVTAVGAIMTEDRPSDQIGLSFIIPVYNVEDYLGECAESLLRQSGDDLEFIFIDDGSTDTSGLLLDMYVEADDRVRVIHQANRGVSAARNKGIDIARGEYVCFVDADDSITSDMTEKTLDAAYADDADIVVFSATPKPPVDWVIEVLETEDVLAQGDGRTILLTRRGCVPFTFNKLYRRSLLEEYGVRFNTNMRLGEDAAFQYLAFPEAHTVAFMPDKLYDYRSQRPGSAMQRLSTDKISQLLQHIDIFEYILRTWETRGYLDDMRSALLQGCNYFFADAYKLPDEQRMEFGRVFRKLFERWFSPEDLEGCDPGMRRFYENFLAWGAGNRAKVFAARAKVKLKYRDID